MKKTLVLVAALATGATVLTPGTASAATVTALAFPSGATKGAAWAVNGGNVAAGYVGTDTAFYAVRWNAAGALTKLAGPSGATKYSARDINSGGVVVGSSEPSGAALRWSATGALTVLKPAGGKAFAWASGINDSGVAVGASNDANGQLATVWAANGTATSFGEGAGYAINKTGVVAGGSAVAGIGSRPTRWSATGAKTVLPVAAGQTIGSAAGINDSGVVAGTTLPYTNGIPGVTRAQAWNADGTLRNLPCLPGSTGGTVKAADLARIAPPSVKDLLARTVKDSGTTFRLAAGQCASIAYAVRNDGAIVGGINDGTTSRAVRWNPDGTVTSLGFLSGTTTSLALGTNETGTTVGTSGTKPVRWNG
ncbi:hypothetical protein [Actinomadura hibisca]|uniref:hypothetical protein n=1 Tax=Actinomadura hibisca TaxID=68565 RepID=UPI00082A262F|nr:hypothetical protein [Actinomadura hibisca]